MRCSLFNLINPKSSNKTQYSIINYYLTVNLKKNELTKKISQRNSEHETKHFFLKADTTIVNIKHFYSTVLRNKDDQYCDRAVVFSSSDSIEVDGKMFRDLSNSLIFIVFFVALSVSNSFGRSPPHCIFSMCLIAA